MKMAPELSLKNKWVATAALIAGLMVSGCAGSSSPSTEKLPPAPAKLKKSELPPTNTGNPSLDSINRFRKDILTKHQARIFMGDCVSWPNGTDGVTVTLNPGVASVATPAGKREHYFVFEAPDQDTVTGLIEMNGPAVNSGEVFTTLMPKSILGRPLEGVEDISLSQAVDDKNGQRFFEDSQTGLPVMDTALINGQLSPRYAMNACIALSEHRDVPGQI